MALDRTDPYAHLPRPSMFAKVLTPGVVITPTKPKPPVVITPKAKVARLSALVDGAVKRKGNRMIGVRLEPKILTRLEAWAKANDAGSLPDAIRTILERELPT